MHQDLTGVNLQRSSRTVTPEATKQYHDEITRGTAVVNARRATKYHQLIIGFASAQLGHETNRGTYNDRKRETEGPGGLLAYHQEHRVRFACSLPR